MKKSDRTLIISTSIAAAALLLASGAVPAVCACLLALYVREHTLRAAARTALRQVAVQLESETDIFGDDKRSIQ